MSVISLVFGILNPYLSDGSDFVYNGDFGIGAYVKRKLNFVEILFVAHDVFGIDFLG